MRCSRILIALLLLVSGLVLVVVAPGVSPPAEAATRVAKDTCRRIDPNLVNGACLRFKTRHGTGLTWIGTYRAPSGQVFFCIDYLYDSRLPRRAQTVSTDRIVNQFGDRVGDKEVAALNYVISTWAGDGSTGSDERDAAIALIIREVMSDGVRGGGAVIYPPGLDVGEPVRPPIGGLGGQVMALAQGMWREASASYGPYRLVMQSRNQGPMRIGRTRTYRVQVLADAGRPVPGVRVSFVCTGPIRCPRPLVSTTHRTKLRIKPTDVGRYRIRAYATGPSSDGLLYRTRGWHAHDGDAARNAGKQRGWIAQESRTTAVVQASAKIRKARPEVVTKTSEALVTPGAEIHDVVTVSGLPAGYAATVTASLYGPFEAQPGRDSCMSDTLAGEVTFDVAGNGTYQTPPVTVDQIGYYTWVEELPGDDYTVPATTRCGIVEETSQVIAFTPEIRTTASRQRAFVGDTIHDTVVVSGIEDSPVTIQWILHGPRPVQDGSCRDVSWGSAPIAGRGQLAASGDGHYRTPETTLTRAGCYTYSQHLPATALTTEATSPPGLVPETALAIRRTPEVTTVASDQHALVGERIFDTVKVRGLSSADRVTVRWWLHGPLAPRNGTSCDGLSWQGAPVADAGELPVQGNGTHETRSTLVEVPGCYTYSERLPATTSTEPTSTPPGVPVETALVTRPVTPYIPEIPSGPARLGLLPDEGDGPEAVMPSRRTAPRYLYRSYIAPAAPAHARRSPGGQLSIERIGLSARVDSVGLDHGVMAIPNNRHRLGWLATTAATDDLLGSSVISGHVSDRHDRPGALSRLRRAKVGDLITWTDASGETRRFVVRQLKRYSRSRGVPGHLFRTDGPRLLHLVTCTNRRSTGGGGFHYADNLVVTAQEVR